MLRPSSFLLGIAILSLFGCTTFRSVDDAQMRIGDEMSDWSWFSIQSPQKFKEHIVRDDSSVALTTYNTATAGRKNDDFSVHLYPSISGTCSPSLTGVSQIKSSTAARGSTSWGRVDYMDGYGGEGWQYAYDPKNILCKIEGTPPPNSVYALCSEKDSKTVVICISQMTDNPKLAEDIFKTFKWTK